MVERAHRFLSHHALYQLLLLSMLGAVLVDIRVERSHSSWYMFMIWNLILAWIPYLCSTLLMIPTVRQARQRWLPWLIGLIWLVFFPNAPYILTDFVHLTETSNYFWWYDALLVCVFAWTGLVLAFASLRQMHLLVRHVVGRVRSWLVVLAVTC